MKAILPDLTGRMFGKWFVIRRAHLTQDKWLCRCNCKRTDKIMQGCTLRMKRSQACILCGATARLDITNQRFGRLLAIRYKGRKAKLSSSLWLCQCDCGKKTTVLISSLRNGTTVSCGCYQKDIMKGNKRHLIHGGADTSLYNVYRGAMSRCNNPSVKKYGSYGGRGIKFLFSSFEQFREVLGPQPSPKHTVDRINTNGHYAPGNVRWATRQQQCLNRRKRTTSRSRYKGVYWNTKGRRWTAGIRVDGRQIHLGYFQIDEQEQAAEAYDKAAISAHGREYTHLNFPDREYGIIPSPRREDCQIQ